MKVGHHLGISTPKNQETAPGKSAYSASTAHTPKASYPDSGGKSKSEVSLEKDQLKTHSQDRNSSLEEPTLKASSKSEVSLEKDQLKTHSQDRNSSLEEPTLKASGAKFFNQLHSTVLRTPKTSGLCPNEIDLLRANESFSDVTSSTSEKSKSSSVMTPKILQYALGHSSRKSAPCTNTVSYSSSSGLVTENNMSSSSVFSHFNPSIRSNLSYPLIGPYVIPKSHSKVSLDHAFQYRELIKNLVVDFEGPEPTSKYDDSVDTMRHRIYVISHFADTKLEECYISELRHYILETTGMDYMKDENQNTSTEIIKRICQQYPRGLYNEDLLRDLALVSFYFNFHNRVWLHNAIKQTEDQFCLRFGKDATSRNFFDVRAKIKMDSICRKVKLKIKEHYGVEFGQRKPSLDKNSRMCVRKLRISMGFSIKEVPQYVDGFLTYPRDMVNLVDQQTLINIAETTVDRNEFLQRVMELGEQVWMNRREKASSPLAFAFFCYTH